MDYVYRVTWYGNDGCEYYRDFDSPCSAYDFAEEVGADGYDEMGGPVD